MLILNDLLINFTEHIIPLIVNPSHFIFYTHQLRRKLKL